MYELLLHSLASTQRVFIGVTVAAVIGILLGIIRSGLPFSIKKNIFFKFFIDAPRFVAPIAWIPLIILLFGIGNISAYVIVFIGAVFPVFISTYEGAERVPFDIKESALSMRIKPHQYIWEIAFFSALPQIFTGIRVGTGMGWMSVIAAEMVSGQSGLGYSIQLYRLTLRYDLLCLNILAIGIIGFLLTEIVRRAEKLVIPWAREIVT